MGSILDSRWRQRALGGDAAAIALLAEVALRPLYRFCYYRVGQDRHLCEDVVQDTLVRAIDRLADYHPDRCGGNILGWLTGLARNEIRRALSRDRTSAGLQRLWQRVDRELLAVYARLDSEPFADELLVRAETRQMVSATMSQIPAHYGAALEAKYVLGHSVRQMAAALGLTEKAVESLLGRARAAFRAAFTALARNLDPDAP